ncbi:unnamed protein product (macronuclear) [Paramecium tetraurelia]|uniref:VWFA domain-containing protein n=1 Tax=Paramecium tetraurelia TaxID=5888 RepID=A0DJC6_PARTE|nr:uncharacterized protein GSPATT00017487001 [Paramecium tetraurelia]CAK83143.1 unnamed protein product [Paramecium tetraurelia]|eukprot:XP_001450540.1 hypothetical protein (macronuclear) [Paramecium tetraurelia strain d4-2]
MTNIQHHFKLIVTQTLFFADLIETTISLSVLFILVMYWINSQISSNNETIIEIMKANITLTGIDLQQTISSIGFLFNISKLTINQQEISQQNSTLQTTIGAFTASEMSQIAQIEEITKIYIPNLPYFVIQLSSGSLCAQNTTLDQYDFKSTPNCTNHPKFCQLLEISENSKGSFNLFQYMKSQMKDQAVFYSLFPFNIQLTQICGQLVSDSLYQCFILDLAEYKYQEGILYTALFTINNSVISDVSDDCLTVDLKCSPVTELSNMDLNDQNNQDIVEFLESIEKTYWVNQIHTLTRNYESSNPIISLSMVDMKVYFYQAIKIGTYDINDEFSSEYKEDLLNQTKEEQDKLIALQQNFNRWQLLATFNDQLYTNLVETKQEDYFDFFLFFQFFILFLLLTPILVNIITQNEFDQISITLNQVSLMMQMFFELDYDTMHKDLNAFKESQKSNLTELNELLQIFDEFCWLIEFLNQLNKKVHDLQKLEQGLHIFEKRNSIECLELILMKLVTELSRQKDYETAITYNKQLISILEQQKKDIQLIKSEEIMRINYKLFQSLNQLLDLLSKLLIRNKSRDRNAFNQAKTLFSNIMDFADTLEIKFTLQIKLFFKKCKLLFNLRKIKEAEQCIDQAQLILQQNYTLSKNASYQNKTFNQDKKLLQVVQQKIYFYRGLIYMSSGQLQPAIQQLMLALDYGNVYKAKLRVKTIKMLSSMLAKQDKFRSDSQTLKQLQYFFQNQKRQFVFLIDSTQRMAENQLEVVETIKQIFQNMNDDDLIQVSTFDEYTHVLIESQSKISILETMGKNYMEDGFFDYLSGRQTQNQRKLYQGILESLNQDLPRKYTNYLIVMTFGENYAEQNDKLVELLEKLRDGFWHFILCSSQEKKYMNQRNNFYRLTDEARDGTYIELFANFEEGLSKIISLCS